MDLSRIIWPAWLAIKPQYTTPTIISTQEELRNAASANDSAVWLANSIVLTGQPLAVTGYNVYIGMQPAGEPTPMPAIIAPAGANRVLAIEGAARVEFDTIVIDGNAETNDQMIAANVNRTTDLTFTRCEFARYGRIGARFVGNNTRVTFDGCEVNGQNRNIFHGIGISDDGPNRQFVIYDTVLHFNGVKNIEYGGDFHVDGLILADSRVLFNGRCIKLPSARNAWIYGNEMWDGANNNLSPIFIYQHKGGIVPHEIYIFDNKIYGNTVQIGDERVTAHLRYEDGAQIVWMGNGTYDLIGNDMPERFLVGGGGGTITRHDQRIIDFMDGQTLPPAKPPQPPPVEPPTPPIGDMTDEEIAALITDVSARVLEHLAPVIDTRMAGIVDDVADELARRLGSK